MKKIIISLILVTICLASYSFLNSKLLSAAWLPPENRWAHLLESEASSLSKSKKIPLENGYGPEDVAVDKEGNLYAGVHSGKFDFSGGYIVKIAQDGTQTVFANTNSWVTGLHFSKEGKLIACDQKRGLISIEESGEISVLASHDAKGRELKIPNDIDIADDGTIYFSNTSHKTSFSISAARSIVASAQADGGLFQYDPQTRKVSTLIDGGFFANGVALSKEGDFVLLVDTAKYQVRQFWLKGKKRGQQDIFIDDLPGFPNGISRRADGGFWLGFTTKRNAILDFVHPYPWLKKIMLGLPTWMQPKQQPFGLIMLLDRTGKIERVLLDKKGTIVSEASSVTEYNGHLYIGGDLKGHISKFKLD